MATWLEQAISASVSTPVIDVWPGRGADGRVGGRDGSDVLIAEMAADVTAVRTAEIARMRQMLQGH